MEDAMQVPLELTFRDVNKTPALEELINEKVDDLEKVCDNLISCRMAVEKPQEHQKSGNPYRVRLNLRVPPGHEIVVKREPGTGNMHDPVDIIIRDAFSAAHRQLRELVEKQQQKVKSHPEQEVAAVVSNLYPDDGYGFLKTTEGREVYFTEKAVVHDKFEDLKIGDGVRFVGRVGDDGFHATTVQVVNKPSE